MLCTLVDNMMVHRPRALMASTQRVIVQKRYNSVPEPAGRHAIMAAAVAWAAETR